MGMPSCSCIPPDKDGGKWIRECDYHREIRLERDFLERICSHAGLLSAQESHNRYVDLVNELIEAAAPFLSSDIVDEVCGTIPLVDRLELAINNLRLK